MLDTILRPVALPQHFLGRPAPCDFFDAKGTLLLKAGIPISPRAGQMPGARRLYCHANHARRISPVDPVAQLRETGQVLSVLTERAAQGEAVDDQAFFMLANKIYEIWSLDADACIGYARLVNFARPSVRRVLLAALLAAELAMANGMSRQAVLNIIGAALTMNLSSMTLHDELFELPGEPDRSVRNALDLHPVEAVMLLQRIGTFPQEWLDAVAQHHENVDGSGYPWGLQRAEIALTARILRVADTLTARMTGRKYRPPRHWSVHQIRDMPHLMKHVFGSDLKLLDQTLVRLLMTQLGAFSPGTLLRLQNGEIAVIARRDGQPIAVPREVLAIMDAKGQALETPCWRSIGPHHYRIQGYANDDLHRWPAFDWPSVWGYGHRS